MRRCEVAVVGHGVVGLVMARLLAAAGIDVVLLGEAIPTAPATAPDPMVHAINHASAAVLAELGIVLGDVAWAAPFTGVQVWDGQTGAELGFDAKAMGHQHLGHIAAVARIRWQLWQSVQQDPGITCLCPVHTEHLAWHKERPVLQTSAGVLAPDLLVAADGVNSWVRAQLGISAHQWSCRQAAITAVLRSAKPHGGVARQVFLAQGPLALLPLADAHEVVMVWSLDDDKARLILSHTPEQLAQAASAGTQECLGALKVLSSVKSFPLQVQHAKHYHRDGVVLVGDAAHRIHPLAGQGANLGIADVKALAKELLLAKQHGLALATPALLARYQRGRRAANWRMLLACDALQRGFALKPWWAQSLRAAGMRALNKSSSAKRALLAEALGV
jgi:2-polyprenylphenol 6-hydroxylase